MKYLSYTIEDFLTDDTFINYCKGTPAGDVQFWSELKTQHPELAVNMGQAEQLFVLLSLGVDPQMKVRELQKLQAVIEQQEENDHQYPRAVETAAAPRRMFSKLRVAWFSSAAAVLLCIGTYAILQRNNGSTSPVPLANIQNNNVIYKTGVDERRTVTLADGASVVMNALSTLEVDEHYNQQNRVLWLNGEAYFQVAKNKEKPFIVVSGKTTTTALGTAFKVNNYGNNGQVSVMLGTGKVSIGRVSGSEVAEALQLLPGEMVQVSGNQDQYARSTFDVSEIDNWTKRKISFAVASLATIKAVLKQTYGVEISSVNQPKKPIAFTGDFENESLTEVLTAIGFSNHFTYTIDQDQVVLRFDQ